MGAPVIDDDNVLIRFVVGQAASELLVAPTAPLFAELAVTLHQ
jgi:hypothetical protein